MVEKKEIVDWFNDCLGCVAGRLELSKGRYHIARVATPNDVLDQLGAFKRLLRKRQAVACYFFLASEYGTTTVAEQIRLLANLLCVLRPDAGPDELINGGSLSLTIAAQCPVTGKVTQFTDFDVVAFSPNAKNLDDDLYDPLMAAPALSANLNSDVYAFSLFTRDLIVRRTQREPYQIDDIQTLKPLFTQSAKAWQRMAERTISNYVDMTNTKRCPTSLSSDRRFWFASHQDPAFAETVKELYRHEMPKIYTRRIINSWLRVFKSRPQPKAIFTPQGIKA